MTMKTYEVSEHKHDRQTITVDARNEFSAVKKADANITGRKTTAKVLWNGLTAEISGRKYNKPVVVWQK